MWLLVIIMLNIVPGVDRTTVLTTFTTEAECRSEQVRIQYEMEQSYPGDTDYIIACQLQPSKVVR